MGSGKVSNQAVPEKYHRNHLQGKVTVHLICFHLKILYVSNLKSLKISICLFQVVFACYLTVLPLWLMFWFLFQGSSLDLFVVNLSQNPLFWIEQVMEALSVK